MKYYQMPSFGQIKRTITSKWYWSILPVSFCCVFALFSFRPIAEVNSSQKNISFELNNQIWKSVMIADATISRSEQTKNIFAKTLNINAIDANGSSLALTIFDVKNGKVGECLTFGKYYGQEHNLVQNNFTFDIGMASFSNKCNLIYQNADGKLMSSRNGMVTIEKCDNGKISGSFEFKTDSNEIFSKGKFVDVLFNFSE